MLAERAHFEASSKQAKADMALAPSFRGQAVEFGTTFGLRTEMRECHLHRPLGLDVWCTSNGAYSLILTDRAFGSKDEGARFTLPGHGMTDEDGRLIEDQDFEDDQNASLKANFDSKTPVHVIRSSSLVSPFAPVDGFRYDGVYNVTKVDEETRNGKRAFRFTLEAVDALLASQIPRKNKARNRVIGPISGDAELEKENKPVSPTSKVVGKPVVEDSETEESSSEDAVHDDKVVDPDPDFYRSPLRSERKSAQKAVRRMSDLEKDSRHEKKIRALQDKIHRLHKKRQQKLVMSWKKIVQKVMSRISKQEKEEEKQRKKEEAARLKVEKAQEKEKLEAAKRQHALEVRTQVAERRWMAKEDKLSKQIMMQERREKAKKERESQPSKRSFPEPKVFVDDSILLDLSKDERPEPKGDTKRGDLFMVWQFFRTFNSLLDVKFEIDTLERAIYESPSVELGTMEARESSNMEHIGRGLCYNFITQLVLPLLALVKPSHSHLWPLKEVDPNASAESDEAMEDDDDEEKIKEKQRINPGFTIEIPLNVLTWPAYLVQLFEGLLQKEMANMEASKAIRDDVRAWRREQKARQAELRRKKLAENKKAEEPNDKPMGEPNDQPMEDAEAAQSPTEYKKNNDSVTEHDEGASDSSSVTIETDPDDENLDEIEEDDDDDVDRGCLDDLSKMIEELKTNDFDRLSPETKLHVLVELCNCAMDTSEVREAVEQGIENIADAKRDLYSAEVELKRKQKEISQLENEKKSAEVFEMKRRLQQQLTSSNSSENEETKMEEPEGKTLVEVKQMELELTEELQDLTADVEASKDQVEKSVKKGLVRVEPLGSDRFHSRYWAFGSHDKYVRVEMDPVGHNESWARYETGEEIDGLGAFLDTKGPRESALKSTLESRSEALKNLFARRERGAIDAEMLTQFVPSSDLGKEHKVFRDAECYLRAEEPRAVVEPKGFFVCGSDSWMRSFILNIESSITWYATEEKWDPTTRYHWAYGLQQCHKSSDFGSYVADFFRYMRVECFRDGWISERGLDKWLDDSTNCCSYADLVTLLYEIDAAMLDDLYELNLPFNKKGKKKKTDAIEIDYRDVENSDDCERCGEGGNLICCEYCPSAFHVKCVSGLKAVPEGDWLCQRCDLKQYLSTVCQPTNPEVIYEMQQLVREERSSRAKRKR